MNLPRWSPEARRTQAVRELLRMIRAVIRDGNVTELEAEFLVFWLDENADILSLPPLDRVVPALSRLVEERAYLDPATRQELLTVLEAAAADQDGPSLTPGD